MCLQACLLRDGISRAVPVRDLWEVRVRQPSHLHSGQQEGLKKGIVLLFKDIFLEINHVFGVF